MTARDPDPTAVAQLVSLPTTEMVAIVPDAAIMQIPKPVITDLPSAKTNSVKIIGEIIAVPIDVLTKARHEQPPRRRSRFTRYRQTPQRHVDVQKSNDLLQPFQPWL
jgi:hypothetical protein